VVVLLKKIRLLFLLFIFIFITSSCGDNIKINLINSNTLERQSIKISKCKKCSLECLPNILEGHYVKGYSFKNDNNYIDEENTIELKYDDELYYTLGIKKDFFDIKSVGTVIIDCSNNINSKDHYVEADITVAGENFEIRDKANIRLRGNTTLWVDKKSYKIKFENKQNLLGMGSDKEWALLANYFDPTHLRNYYAYKLAIALGLEYSCECEFVEVYINNEYNGLYLLTETVKTSEERVNIELKTDTAETPFLLELDMKLVDDNPNYRETIDDEMFLIDNSKNNNKIYPFGTKYPKSFKDISDEQYDYIKNYISETYQSVRNGNYKEYIDIDSFINYFLIQELFMNPDLDYSSVYLYKPYGEKLKFGPIWDFDLSSGNAGYVKGYSHDKWMKDINGGSYLFNELYKYDEFKDLFRNRYENVNLDIIPALIDSIEYNYKYLKQYSKKDNKKWNVLNDDNWARPSHLVGISYKEQVDYFKDYLFLHNIWIKENI
jgi:hypothetical protein